jgi:PAS domain S-box-containing protein
MSIERLNVLLVGDDLGAISRIQRLLAASEAALDSAESLALGLQKAAQNRYQALLLDLELAKNQGQQALQSFAEQFPELPIIALGTLADEALAAQAVQRGAQDYLLKDIHLSPDPAGKALLIRSIRYAIERSRIQAALRQERDMVERRILGRTAELSNANEQLKRELAERRRYEFIANTSKDPISLIDRNYTYQAVNDGFCLAQNMKREELIGKTIADVWGQEAFENKIKPYLDRALAGYETQYEGWFHFKTLGFRYFEVFYNPFFDADRQVTHVVVVSHDETIREKAKESLRHHNQRLSILREIDHAIMVAQSPEDIVRVALRHFVRLVPYDRADVMLFSPDGKSLMTMITGGVEGEAKINPTQLAVDDLLQNEQLRQGKPYIVYRSQHTAELSPFGSYLHQRGVRSYFIVPLHADRKLLGVLSVSSFDVDTFLPSHIEDALAISVPLTLLIKNAQLLEQLRTANERLLSLTSHLVSAQEDERRRLSLELHDEAGQSLTALKLNLELLQAELPAEMPRAQARLAEAISLTERTMNDLRALAYNLRPPAIDAVGLSQTLQDYCQRVARQTHIQISYWDNLPPDLPGHIQLSLYRLVQEALTNIVRHSGASQAEVRLECNGQQILAHIADNGRGFNPNLSTAPDISRGLGLIGIRDRMQALGGEFETVSRPGEGTRLIARIPLQEAA